MTIQEFIKSSGMTHKQLSERFGIPKRTIEDWSRGVRKCPEYVVGMMEEAMRADNAKIGIITVEDFEKAVKEFGFNHPVCTALWNTMSNNPNNAEEFETVYAFWTVGKYKEV